MTNLYFYKLNYNIHDILYVNKVKELKINNGILTCDPIVFLKENFYQKLKKLGTLFCMLFEKKPFENKIAIHTDTNDKYFGYPCLNIVIQGKGSMNWYLPKTKPIKLKNPAGQDYYSWFTNYGESVCTWNNSQVAIVDINTPHGINNNCDETRICASIRWIDKKMSMEETIKWFNKNFYEYENRIS